MTPTFDRKAIAQAAMKLVHPLIHETLLNDREFRENFGIKINALISFSDSGVSVQRSELYDAVRAVLAGTKNAEVSDTTGGVCFLNNEIDEEGIPRCVLTVGEKRLNLPDFAVFADNATLRISSLERSAENVNLSTDAKERWRLILSERALDDNEFDSFYADMRDTPAYVAHAIRSQIFDGKSTISSLVPNSRRYFQRLVGAYDDSISIRGYAAGAGRTFFKQLSELEPYDGFLYSLLLSSHLSLTTEISVEHLEKDKLIQAYEFIVERGDTLSCLGALEVGLRVLPERPEVEPFLLHLVHRIRDEDVEDNANNFKLFSSLFILVDGELSRTRLMAGEPPFYRRLASLSHAALIHRQLVQSRVDYEIFSDWAISKRGEQFFMQSLADMRAEPRWDPNLVSAPQMKAEFFGRIMNAGNYFANNIGESELRETILGNGDQSLRQLSEFPHPYLPGPLEGTEDSPNAMPDDLAHVIKEQLNADEVDASSFIALVNSAMIFRITSNHAELAAKALRVGNYTLANLKNKPQLVGILNGLATVAAVSRNPALADELRILVRRYRRDSQYSVSIGEAMWICLVASAARKDFFEWRGVVGEWLTELALGELEGDEGKVLHTGLLALLHSVPGLWASCAKADAALQAWRFR